ncbi:hypothetical protein ACFLVK_00025 [Chloroflexota bacterium]
MPDRYVTCPKCQTQIPVIHKVGRKPLGIPVNIVYDAVKRNSTVLASALELGCSRGYIYKTLTDAGQTVKGVRR